MEYIKGGKSVRLQVYCQNEKEANGIKKLFGGSIRKVKDAEWNKAPELPKPLKIRDVFLVSAESDPKKLKELSRQHPKR